MNNTQRLLDLKETIDEAKNKKAELTGELKSKMKELKEKFSVGTIEKAKIKLEKLTAKKSKLQDEINESLNTLEENYEW
jgi:hypothetical protein